MKPLKEWVAQILAIKPDRTLDEIYGAMHGFYTREQILMVWKPEDEKGPVILLHPAKLGGVSIALEPEEEDDPEEDAF